MSYVTLKIEIDHGRVVAKEAGQLPEKATGLLTILDPAGGSRQESVVSVLEALQAYLRLDAKKAGDWMGTVREARR